ncbi:MAG: undecaprenyl/decaprenyl-phosphate alpha-N-acetylglucosaminyl 1-phosphate transferase [Alphaproteobacteria bacterium]|nr:undecaprenyl/decaprenyl-phosphate alpha-N-acetylglucosaminyl 1-phosphate transferase [Alphaproteobacteria bacterium]
MIGWAWILPPLLAFLAVAALVPLARIFALKADFVDRPGGRKQHEGAVPLVGGLVIFPVFMVVGFLSGFDLVLYWPLFAALTLLLITGAIDDRAHLTPWVKFFLQFCAAGLIVIPGHAMISNLGNIFSLGTLYLGFMALPFSVIAVVLLINAINLMDGLDGLAAGENFVALGWLMLACIISGNWPPFFEIAILMGALAGFLIYNMRHPFRSKASIFLGDAGSMCLGLMLGWFAIGLAAGETDRTVEPIAVAWVLALPIMDACGQFYRRVRAGRHPFSPDRGHFHHHFIDAGLSPGKATTLILLLSILLGGVGIVGIALGVPQILLTLLWIALLFTHMALSDKPETYVRLIKMLLHRRAEDHDTR